jgi:hypothetical protein
MSNTQATAVKKTAIILGYEPLIKQLEAGTLSVQDVQALFAAGAVFYCDRRPEYVLHGEQDPGKTELIDQLHEVLRAAHEANQVIWAEPGDFNVATLGHVLALRRLPPVRLPFMDFTREELVGDVRERELPYTVI